MSLSDSRIQVLFVEGFNVYVCICVCYSVCERVYVRDLCQMCVYVSEQVCVGVCVIVYELVV